jgi:hypothetical protein
MKKEFININDSILDYEKYIKDVMLLKAYLKKTLAEAAIMNGFEVMKNENPRYCETTLILFNKKKDLELELTINKKTEEKFT